MSENEMDSASRSDVVTNAVSAACKMLQATLSDGMPRSLRWALTGAFIIHVNPFNLIPKITAGGWVRDAAEAFTALSDAADRGLFDRD